MIPPLPEPWDRGGQRPPMFAILLFLLLTKVLHIGEPPFFDSGLNVVGQTVDLSFMYAYRGCRRTWVELCFWKAVTGRASPGGRLRVHVVVE